MGDERRDVDLAAAEIARRTLPAVPDAPAEDTVDRDPLGDDQVVEVEGDRPVTDAQQAHPTTTMEHLKPLLDRHRMARHFQDNIDADPTVELANVLDRRRRGREDRRRTHPLRQLATVGVGLDAVDGRRTLRPSDADGAETDGTETEDRHRVIFSAPAVGAWTALPKGSCKGATSA